MSIKRALGPAAAGDVPSSTYRLQLRSGVDFDRAIELVSHLHDLGIDCLYLSPPFAARPGSSHGYDVVDPNALDPALGGEERFRVLAERVKQLGMRLLIDIVPNHVAADPGNRFWWDVLQAGQRSPYAQMFDVDWDSTGGKLYLPVLGSELPVVLSRDEIALVFEHGQIQVKYFDLALPLAPASLALVLEPDLPESAESAESVALLERTLKAVTGDRLAAVLDAQVYRLRHWRGPMPLNYRRFFTISELVGVRAERPEVFEATHALICSLLSEGLVDGLRVDHPDGMRDPVSYVELLAERALRARGGRLPYLVLEKILHADEPLDPALPVHGTTGYDTLNLLDAVLVDGAGARGVLDAYIRFTGRGADFASVAQAAKKRVLDDALSPEVWRLAELSAPLLGRDASDLLPVLRELVACFPVYRSYVRDDSPRVEGRDLDLLEAAFATARESVPELSPLLEPLKRVMLAPPGEPGRELLMRFQQLTGPAAAKGIEDTAFYRWFPLASLCEVGGSPDRFGIELADFHSANAARAQIWPHTMLASSTHDTKRSEDVRARISALSEMPKLWQAALDSWGPLNRRLKREVDGELSPDPNDEYLVYQTLLGVWPLSESDPELPERLEAYLIKAVREAKRSSAWIQPSPAYERATVEFATALLDSAAHPEFFRQFSELERRTARAGALSSLARLVLKVTCPGVPDFYQGSELWDLSLVDPDNRRSVDWKLRARLLAEISDAEPRALLESFRDGRIKLWLTHRLLGLRKRRAELFAQGDYTAVSVAGPGAERVVAFTRTHGSTALLVVVGRFFVNEAPDAWEGTTLECELASGEWTDALGSRRYAVSGGTIPSVAELFRDLPFAVLERS